ncbi:phage protein [Bifidobacterium actinocoloniiforme DSM 22766]|uniref:Phage protein n=1 Tax=Bifidobacterium actinocoloniiforme DSM 22766 TaxID=1437605 RepID=A0A086Z1J1_9BIFI|nr:hypothetical protein [Bifidobacterium actinocoloniiforme]KFI40391.1 phage protein [Bifidobacterium actinocoloniiforme DSM 22766]
MTWFKVDDNLTRNEKMVQASLSAVGLWVEAGAWASASQTDGRVLKRVLRTLHPDATEEDAQTLVDVGLWEDHGDYWQIHDFLKYNPPREKVKAQKELRSEAGKLGGIKSGKVRRSKQEANASANAEAKHEANAEAKHEAKTNPVPVPLFISKDINIVRESRPEIVALCERLQDWIVRNGSKRPDITQRWLDAARLMIDTDGRDPQEAARLIDWCQQDSFWKSNILSMPKFRAKYDQLRLRAQSSSLGRARTQANQDANAALVARYMAEEQAQNKPPQRKEIGS